jgi:outer membrane lipoprotein SlyB
MVGAATGGTINLPQSFGTVKSLRAELIGGPLVEAAAHAIERYGNPVVCVPTGASTPAVAGAPVKTGTGTSVVTVTGTPADDFEIFVAITKAGPTGELAVGTEGIELQWSRDNGRTMSAITALGTALEFEIPGSGVTLVFAVGTLVTGDTIYVSCTAAQWNATELADAMAPLAASQIDWSILSVVGDLTASDATAIDGRFAGYAAAGQFRMWIGNARIPTVGESDAAYQAVLAGAWGNVALEYGSVCAGAELLSSSVSAEVFLRPISLMFAPWLAHLSEEIDASALNLGPVPGTIYDENGNLVPRCHDETINPGLDDLRFTCLRSWNSYAGTYVNNPRMLSVQGSDFKYCQARRVINIAAAVLQRYFDWRLSVPVAIDTKTGKILEEEAAEMDKGATAAMAAALTAKPKASGVKCVVSRDDNILATELIHVTARVVPLGYPKAIDIDLAFENPANNVVAA